MKKYAFILFCGLAGALLLSLLGVATGLLTSPGSDGRAVEEETWSMGDIEIRDADSLARLSGRFRQAYSWLPEKPPEPEVSDTDAAANAAPPPPPPPPRWRFVGVLLEDSAAEQFALVSEAGRVNKYRAGDAFMDGTTLVSVSEQSMRISKAGQERDVFLYRRQ